MTLILINAIEAKGRWPRRFDTLAINPNTVKELIGYGNDFHESIRVIFLTNRPEIVCDKVIFNHVGIDQEKIVELDEETLQAARIESETAQLEQAEWMIKDNDLEDLDDSPIISSDKPTFTPNFAPLGLKDEMPFGKYQGATLQMILNRGDWKYIIWLIDNVAGFNVDKEVDAALDNARYDDNEDDNWLEDWHIFHD